MKNLVTIIALTCFTLVSAQTIHLDEGITTENIKLENLNISVTVDSEESIKSTFDVKDMKEILVKAKENQALEFQITCENKTDYRMTNMTYKVKGNSNDVSGFMKSIKVVRKSAIKYYKNKKA